MNTIDNNKLLAEFMGFKLQQDPNERWFGQYFTTPNDVWANRIELLHFDTDWNWLMEVVEKIEQLGYVTEIIGNIERKFTCITYPNTSEEYISRIGYGEEMFLNKKYVTYQAVVAFIKWYNKNK
jgi:hypothetical protein